MTDIIEFTIRREIEDWFKKRFTDTFGPAVNIRYGSSDGHFDSHTNVKISGNNSEINQAIAFIRDTSDELQYKMPWLNGNTYYTQSDESKELIENVLKYVNDTNYDNIYEYTWGTVIHCALKVFNFRPDLDETIKIQIDEIFRIFAVHEPLFVTYPHRKSSYYSSKYTTTNILTPYHGKFLKYLTLEDVLSLDLANNRQDLGLDHDIQKFMRDHLPDLNKIDKINFRLFRTADTLRHFIHKYHRYLKKCLIPNLFEADEIQSLSRLYNLEFEHNSIIHIDFKSTGSLEAGEFCAMCHYDSNFRGYFNYDERHATEKYIINFHADDTLEPLQFSNEFSYFVLKPQNKCAPQKSNDILKCVTEHFKAARDRSILLLYEFDLNHVSSQIINSLLIMMRQNYLELHRMILTFNTIKTILEQSDQNKLVFKNCHIDVDNVEVISGTSSSKRNFIWFLDMDVALNWLCILKNIEFLEFNNCRVLNTNLNDDIGTVIADNINFYHTNFDRTTLLRILNGFQCNGRIQFVNCVFIPNCDLVDRKICPTVRKPIYFINMIFKIPTLFCIFENCEFQKLVIFENCQFNFENDVSHEFLLQPLVAKFCYIKFDWLTLFTILTTLNKESKVFIVDSCILPVIGNANFSNKSIEIKRIRFDNCRLERQTMVDILNKISNKTRLKMFNCYLSPSSVVYPNIFKKLLDIDFYHMKLNSHDLFAILGILKHGSYVHFDECEIIAEKEQLPKISLDKGIELITFKKSKIDSEIARLLLDTDLFILFNNSYVEFTPDEIYKLSIQSNLIFRNMIFDSSAQLKMLAKCTSKAEMSFENCHYELTNFTIPYIVIKPFSICLRRTTFNLESLVRLMEMISEHTDLFVVECDIQLITQVIALRPIKIQFISLENMKLEIETILLILKNFTSNTYVRFVNCKILCSNPNTLPNIKIKLRRATFENMIIDVDTFLNLAHKFICQTIFVDNCIIKPPRNVILTNVPMNLEHFIIANIHYSPDVVQMLQHLNGEFNVVYRGQLSHRAIVEICTKTPVHGKRLKLVTQNCTKTIYFELFAEFFSSQALNFEFDTSAEYSVPTYLIPDIISLRGVCQYDWNAFKIKFVAVSDTIVKLEYLKNGTPIDLFYELNNLTDDSNQCSVDYL